MAAGRPLFKRAFSARPARPRGVSCARWAIAAALLIAPASASADETGQQQVKISEIKLEDSNNAERIFLTFSSDIPTYFISGNDTSNISISFGNTSTVKAVPFANSRGLIREAHGEQIGTAYSISLTTACNVHAEATPVGRRELALSLKTPDPTCLGATSNIARAPKEVGRPSGGEFKLVKLKYADVSEVVGLLADGETIRPNDGFVPHEPAFGSPGMTGSSGVNPGVVGAPGLSNEPLGQVVTPSIGVDRRLNAVVLRGTPEDIARMEEKIATIDVPVDSVILEISFVELNKTGVKNLGLNFNNQSNQIGVLSWQQGASSSYGGAPAGAVLSGSVQAALYAQVVAGNGKVVSRPRIAAQSGASAKIVTGDALPILTSIALSGVNAVSQQVQYVNVGVNLQIAPRVTEDGFVTSHIFCVVSNVTGTSQGYPTISQREAESSATVKDGEAFVIGGLTQDSTISSVNKLPGASSLPLVGGMFKYRSSTKSETELYIVIIPHIVRRQASDPGLRRALK
jgi:general secretion pathway protein D